MKKIILTFLLINLLSIPNNLFISFVQPLAAQTLSKITPIKAGLNESQLKNADYAIEKAISDGVIPGAVLAVVKGDKVAYLKAYGNKSVYPQQEKMDVNTIFDMASVSKPIGTAISFMQIVESGLVRLSDNVSIYIPNFKGWVDPLNGEKTEIKIIDLLTHTSGLPPYAPVEELSKKFGSPNPEALINYIAECKRDFAPATKFQYSCLNFITLQNILQNITGEKLADYSKKHVFDVLGLKYTTYNPSENLKELCAPTEKQLDGSVLKGVVHDPLARIMNGGNSGNAGLFSNAEDLAVIAAALMNGGKYKGKRILGKLTVETMTRVPKGYEEFGRSLGWDNYSSYASNNGNLFHPTATYGHTGYTGTSIVIDPIEKVAVILLTNRVHPQDKGSVVRLRAVVANIIASSIN